MNNAIKKGIAALAKHAERYGNLKAQAELATNGKAPSPKQLEHALGLLHQEREDLLASIEQYVRVLTEQRFEAGVELGRSRQEWPSEPQPTLRKQPRRA